MIKYIRKRDGRIEEYQASKLNKWGEWAANNPKLNWSTIVMNTVKGLAETISSKELQEALIRECLNMKTYNYYLMAGRLYAALLHKEILGGLEKTSLLKVHQRLIEAGLMRKLNYSESEYKALNDYIDHEKDFHTPHFSLDHIRRKYALQDRVREIEYETQQFVYMRMAMALCEHELGADRLMHVMNFYDLFSDKILSAPTPNYVNLGTNLQSYASCCLYDVKDTIDSLITGDVIAYKMTAASAGIGNVIRTRSVGDPVRNGMIEHKGKLGYYASLGKAVKANLQNGRGGAATTYYSAFDPEGLTINQLRNPRSVEDKKNRDIHYALQTNHFFLKKVAKNEKVFVFNSYTAPDLHEAFYRGDKEVFERLYDQYEKDESFKKTYMSAREFMLEYYSEVLETGTLYRMDMDNANEHTSFIDPIKSSNLCVTGDTLLLTTQGQRPIAHLVGRKMQVWNGHEWSMAKVEKTAENQEIWRVILSNGKSLDCTEYHKWYVKDDRLKDILFEQAVTIFRTNQLKPGFVLIEANIPGIENEEVSVVSIEKNIKKADTFCVSEPKRHMAVFNGILTGNCNEIMQPTEAYNNVFELDRDYPIGHVKLQFKAGETLQEITLPYVNEVYKVIDRKWIPVPVYTLKEGDQFIINELRVGTATFVKFLETVKEPEISLCNLAAIAVENVKDDEEYEKAAFYALRMIDYCIDNTKYVFKHLGFTSKARRNAGVGIMGLATVLAKEGLSYASLEGKNLIHRIAERHAYFLIKASLKLAKERGTAEWMHRTKWVNGWLPIDTYQKKVDSVHTETLKYDWESLRQAIIDNGGIRNSSLIAYMPGEASSKAVGTTNSVYPVRATTLNKTDGINTIRWAAPGSDDPKVKYTIAWELPTKDLIDCYAIIQKFTDQTISADIYKRISNDERLSGMDLIKEDLYMVQMGMKGRYYVNSHTSDGAKLEEVNKALPTTIQSTSSEDDYCESCAL